MAFAIADRVKETTSTAGTGTLALNGAGAQFQSFISAIGNGNTCEYVLLDANGSAWETGIGTVTSGSPNTLSRTTVYASTNSNAKIVLTTGTHTVFNTTPANHAVHSIDLDSAFGSTRGNVLFRGASGWVVLGPGNSGDVLTSGGAGADVSWLASGGGGGSNFSATPTQARTGFTSTSISFNSAIVHDGVNGLLVMNGTGGLQLVNQSAPTAPYAFDLNMLTIIQDTNGIGSGLIGWSDGSNHILMRQWQAYGASQLLVDQWAGNGGGGAGTNLFGVISGNGWYMPATQSEWIRIYDDGTNIGFYWSPTGDTGSWNLIYQQSRTTYISSPSSIVFGTRNESSPVSCVLRSWTRSI